MESIKKNAVFIVGLFVIGGLGLFWFLRGAGEENISPEGVIEQQPSKFAAIRAEILGSIATLQAIKLDISILDDPAFQALTEAPQPPEAPFTASTSKRNPFLP